jgi:DNA-binding winged helix-turn-helix (wHTH) protein
VVPCAKVGSAQLRKHISLPGGTSAPHRCPDANIKAQTTRMNDRRNSQPKDLLSFGPFRLFVAERLLKKADEPIPLGGRALDILIALTDQAGEVVTHKELISRVWPDVTVEDINLRVHIAALRKALGDGRDGARYVSNVSGRGYCFVAPVIRSSAKQTIPVIEATITERAQKLPPRLTRMVGRDDTVRSLAEELQVWRFISIVGPGGVGKKGSGTQALTLELIKRTGMEAQLSELLALAPRFWHAMDSRFQL